MSPAWTAVSSKTLSAASVAACASIWGFIGICTRTLSDAGMDSVQINAIRSTVCLVAISVVLLIFDRGAFRIKARDLWILLLAALTKVGMDVLYIQAQTMIDLSMAGVLLSTNCYFAIAISYLVFRDRVTPRKVVAAVVGFVGCAFAVGLFTGIKELQVLGICIGLGAGFGEALHAATFKLSLDRGNSEPTVLFYVFLLSTAMLVPFSDPAGTVGTMFSGTEVLTASIAIGLVFTALPYYLYSRGLAGLDIGTVSIFMFLETAMATVAGLLFFDEGLSVHSVIGISLIFVSLLIMNRGLSAEEKQDNV
ncbi:MAG: EamA family transporter [Candidatus Methanomethylophilaceae archaeon]|nr:EamA family transporter [Candidatus Methanomethylophilaceae archaeon]